MARTHALENSQQEDLLLRHRSLLMGMARRLCRRRGIDPEDLVQDTLERALRQREWLTARDERTCRAWLCTTLQHRFLDLCRRQRTEVVDAPHLKQVRAPVVMREPRTWLPWERVSEEHLRQAVARLRSPLRETFELHAEGLRYKDIAERLGAPMGTVGCWLFQARRELREWLRPYTEEGEAFAA
jgi:RNA polymerase sigma-70 factor (ECF subfamily)